MHVSEDGSVVGSVDRAKLEELQGSESAPEVETSAEDELEAVKPSMALSKDELVDLAEAAGLGERDELETYTKQELVDELKANEGEG
jgi:hypothetical protein